MWKDEVDRRELVVVYFHETIPWTLDREKSTAQAGLSLMLRGKSTNNTR